MRISSQSNSLVKQIRRLQQRKHRLREGLFSIEGLKVVLSALENGAPVETLITCPELLTSDKGREAAAVAEERGLRHVEVTESVFRAMSERDNPVGIAALVRMSSVDPADLEVQADSLFAAFVDIGDPGNLGTCLRTLDGMGGTGALITGKSTDPWHPAAVKASMGALFSVPFCVGPEVEAVLEWAGENGIQNVASSARGAVDYRQADYRAPALLWVGSEGEGLSDELLERADLSVRIPMCGRASSLNLSVATGLILYQMRDRIGGIPPAGHSVKER